MPVTTIHNVAKAFLTMESMSHKKLQKLCYYAYSWYLALENRHLFRNSFQAWVHGPVDPGLYQTYRDYGWQQIPRVEGADVVDQGTYEFLEQIFESYGHLSGDQLEYLTHQEAPWREARGELPEYAPSNAVIQDQVIREFYLNLYQEGQND